MAKKNIQIYYFALFIWLFGCATVISAPVSTQVKTRHNNIDFSFYKKWLSSDTYILRIVNRGVGTVEFYETKEDYYIISKSGQMDYLDLRGFDSVDGSFLDKNAIWISSNRSFNIPFKIDESSIINASKVIFRCSYLAQKDSFYLDCINDFIITVDLLKGEMSVEETVCKVSSIINNSHSGIFEIEPKQSNKLPDMTLRKQKTLLK